MSLIVRASLLALVTLCQLLDFSVWMRVGALGRLIKHAV